ncbi:MAG: hypothetical protein KKA90_00570 [Nanoarchaeota archaeon]|nr:hypothetical protein [Nanoarchaeota archaeon]
MQEQIIVNVLGAGKTVRETHTVRRRPNMLMGDVRRICNAPASLKGFIDGRCVYDNDPVPRGTTIVEMRIP